MTSPQSVVHALTALGMAELDAWRCVHLMQGRDSLVLLRLCRAGEPPPPAEPPAIDIDVIADAVAHGAAWSSLGPGSWQYLRQIRWCISHLEQLQDDLCRLAALGQPE